MTIRLNKKATKKDIARITSFLKENGFDYHVAPGKTTTLICIVGEETEKAELLKSIGSFQGVDSVKLVNEPYRLISRRLRPEYNGKTKLIKVKTKEKIVEIGKKPVIIAGPCTVYNLEQILDIANSIKEDADILRGGAFKPRTSPYDFQGLGKSALEMLAIAREQTSLPVITEVMDTRDIELVASYADILQIGARNMQNYPLLREAGKQKKPVMLKRHPYSSLKEWLCAAEYIAKEGNENIILCERGIRTTTNGEYDRNTIDLAVISAAKEKTFLPVIVDPSHGTGRKELIESATLSALTFHADGVIIEVMRNNEKPVIEYVNGKNKRRKAAYCDYAQSITISEFRKLAKKIRKTY